MNGPALSALRTAAADRADKADADEAFSMVGRERKAWYTKPRQWGGPGGSDLVTAHERAEGPHQSIRSGGGNIRWWNRHVHGPSALGTHTYESHLPSWCPSLQETFIISTN